MYKRLFLFLPLLTMILGGCSGGINAVTGVTLDNETITVEETQSKF